MAKLKTIQFDPFKRGDTPVFSFPFPNPAPGFVWTGLTADFAITAVAAPTSNTGAGVYRQNLPLTVDGSNNAFCSTQVTAAESRALVPGTVYNVELQLHDASNVNVATVAVGTVAVLQDYVI